MGSERRVSYWIWPLLAFHRIILELNIFHRISTSGVWYLRKKNIKTIQRIFTYASHNSKELSSQSQLEASWTPSLTSSDWCNFSHLPSSPGDRKLWKAGGSDAGDYWTQVWSKSLTNTNQLPSCSRGKNNETIYLLCFRAAFDFPVPGHELFVNVCESPTHHDQDLIKIALLALNSNPTSIFLERHQGPISRTFGGLHTLYS